MKSSLMDPSVEPTPQLAVLEQLEDAVKNELAELQQAFHNRPVNAVAWVSRNLLELVIWTNYCIESPEHARRFADDQARDALDALNLPDGKYSDDPQFSFQNARTELLNEAKKQSNTDFESGSQRVNAAADIIKAERFAKYNKMFSKFAHPTALWVMMSHEERERWREKLHSGGLVYGQEALWLIARFKEQSVSSTK